MSHVLTWQRSRLQCLPARNATRVGENTEHLNTAPSKFMGEVESRGNKKHASLLADSLSLLLKGAMRHITHKVII